MPAEGMVHALELIYSLLVPQGMLIDIHPTYEADPIEFTLGEKVFHLGETQETDDFIEYRQADAALVQAVQMGLFSQQGHAIITFQTHSDDLTELRQYLEGNWSDFIWQDQINQRAAQLRAQYKNNESRATLREKVNVTCFQQKS
jgi:hypothetical protein